MDETGSCSDWNSSIDSILDFDVEDESSATSTSERVQRQPAVAVNQDRSLVPLDQINGVLRSVNGMLEHGSGNIRISLRRHSGTEATLQFPGRTTDQAWRFTVAIRLLQLVREALISGKIVSKRDLYYRDPALFGSQSTVDRYVDDIARTFGVARSTMNVVAALKGLIYGPVSFHLRNDSILRADGNSEGMLMPDVRDVKFVSLASVKWILVVEKEASFRAIVACLDQNRDMANGIVMTAKGYPDIASRQMLNLLATPSEQNGFSTKPLLALVDFDPDGFNIYGCYKYRCTEIPDVDVSRALSRMQLVGLSSKHITLCELGRSAGSVLELTGRDRSRAVNMLNHSQVAKEEHLRSELQRMLMLNVKVELQHLDGESAQLEAFLESILQTVYCR